MEEKTFTIEVIKAGEINGDLFTPSVLKKVANATFAVPIVQQFDLTKEALGTAKSFDYNSGRMTCELVGKKISTEDKYMPLIRVLKEDEDDSGERVITNFQILAISKVLKFQEKSKISFDEYQKEAVKTKVYPVVGLPIVYPALALAGEAGEVLGKVKKLLRRNATVFRPEDKLEIVKELGDVLYYLSACATELAVPFSTVANTNLSKIFERKAKGSIKNHGKDD